MGEEVEKLITVKGLTTDGWSSSIETELDTTDGIAKKADERETRLDDTRLGDTEKTPLIDGNSTSEVEHSVYGKLQHHKVETTWRHWLIAPVVCLYFFGMMSSFFIVVEYTNEYCKEEEYDKVNLSLSDTSSPCDTNVSDIVTDTEQTATSKASTWLVYFSIASGVPAIFANLIFGSYTDTYGRKFLLAICILGTCLRLAISAIVVYLETDLVYLLIANFVEGCTGQYATCLTVSLAYTADITSPGKSRVNGMILVELLIGIAMSSAGLVTGYMIAAIGYKVSLFISAGVLVLAALITITLLPETLSKDLRQKDKSVIEVLKVVLQFFTLNDDKNSRWKYQIIFLVLVLTNVSYMGRMSTETLYQLATPFCWTPAQVGVYAAVKTVAVMFIGLGSLKYLQRWFDETTLMILGNVSYGASSFWTAFVEDDIIYYLVIAVGVYGPASTTMQRSMLSHLTPPDKQGAIFTAVGILEVVTQLVSNVTTSSIYAATVSYMRGLVFLVLGSYNVLSLLLTIILKIGWHRERRRVVVEVCNNG